MNRMIVIRAILATGGVLYLLTGLAMIFAPQWFFDNIGNFPPYNRHFLGDLGTFTLPFGVGLLWAMRAPNKHHLFIGCAALASVLHTLDHLYDNVVTPQGDLLQTVQLGLVALALVWAWWVVSRQSSTVS
jgi:hypothetical protein